MAKIDVSEIKRKILDFLDKNGPNIPVPIAKHIGLQPMFASAILSELLNEKRIKTSSMKIGTSPLYLIPGQENKLENFVDNLAGVEKEAYLILRDNKLIEDESQEPKIRVALRSLKDFAIPTQMNGKILWRYFTLSENKIKEALKDEGEVVTGERIVGQQIWEDIKRDSKLETKTEEPREKTEEKITINLPEKENGKQEDHAENNKPEISKEKLTQNTSKKIKKLTEKDVFLEQVRHILKSKNIELTEIIQFDKKQVLARARINIDKNCILYFIDKKRPEERDMKKAFKKAHEYNLPYYVFTQSQPSKKLKDSADLYKALLGFGSIE